MEVEHTNNSFQLGSRLSEFIFDACCDLPPRVAVGFDIWRNAEAVF